MMDWAIILLNAQQVDVETRAQNARNADGWLRTLSRLKSLLDTGIYGKDVPAALGSAYGISDWSWTGVVVCAFAILTGFDRDAVFYPVGIDDRLATTS